MHKMFKDSQVKRLYISGKMTGLPDFGFGMFNSAAAVLRSFGFEVFNPAETDEGDTSKPRPHYLRQDVKAIVDFADAVIVLNNWKMSKGALLEVHVARELELPIYDYDLSIREGRLVEVPREENDPEQSILEEAHNLVNGARNQAYGHPYYDYKCTTDQFNALMQKKYGDDFSPLDAADGAMFMICVKLSREANLHKRDNLVDAAGYLLCLDKIIEHTEQPAKSPLD